MSDYEVTFSAEGEEQLHRALHRTEELLDATTKGIGGMSKQLRGVGPSTAVMVAGIELAGRALGAMADAVGRVVEEVYELGMTGGNVDAVMSAFERSGGTVGQILDMREAVGGLITDFRMLPLATRVMRAGLVDFETFNRMMGATVRAAQDHGKDLAASLQGMATALTGGGLEEFTNVLGVNLLSVRESLSETGLSLETTEGRLRGIDLIFEQLDVTLGTVDNSASNLNDAWTQLQVGAENYYDELARGFSTNEDLITLFDEVKDIMEDALPPSEELADTIVQFLLDATREAIPFAQAIGTVTNALARLYIIAQELGAMTNPFAWADAASAALTGGESSRTRRVRMAQGLIGATDTFNTSLTRLEGALSNVDVGMSRAASAFRRMGEEVSTFPLDELDDILGALGGTIPGEEQTINVPGEATGGRRRPRRRPGGGGGGQEQEPLSFEGMLGELGATEGERPEQWIDDLVETAPVGDLFDELYDGAERGLEDYAAFHRQTMREMAEEGQRSWESQQKAMEKMEKKYQAIWSAVDTTGQVVGDLTQIFSIAAGEHAKSTQAMAAVEGAFLIAYNTVMGFTEIAKTASAYPDVVGMATHGIGAVAHFTAAGVAAAELGQKMGGGASGGKGAAGAAAAGGGAANPYTPQHRPEWSMQERRDRGQTGGVVIEVHGVITSQRAVDEIDRALADNRRSRAA